MAAHRAALEGSAREGSLTGARSRWLILGLIGLAALVMAGVVMALRRTSRGLHRITVDLGQSARQVAGMAGRVSAGSQSAAHGASEQAAKLREVTASGAEVNDTAHRNAEKAGLSAELSNGFSHSLTDANERLTQLLAAMGEIQETSERVANIVRLIDGVAFQTNILSLNAAVEAARAGESGLGFAVVASEVRNLAQRSADAAKETAGLIDEAITAARNGMERLEGVSAAFQSLTEGAGKVAALAGELRTGSLEQVRQMEQITDRIEQIRKLTDSASTVAQQGAQAGESLSGEAAGLTHLVSRLVTVVDGNRAAESTV
jgi:methyl-accepting chemotaxis protein